MIDGDFEVKELSKSYHAFTPKDLQLGVIHAITEEAIALHQDTNDAMNLRYRPYPPNEAGQPAKPGSLNGSPSSILIQSDVIVNARKVRHVIPCSQRVIPFLVMEILELSLRVVAVCIKPFQVAYLADFAFQFPVFSAKDCFVIVLQGSIDDTCRFIYGIFHL